MTQPTHRVLSRYEAKSAAVIFGYEAVALSIGPWLQRRFGWRVPPLSDFAVLHPIGTGALTGILAFHLHEHYKKIGRTK